MEPPDTFLVRRLSISKVIQVIKVCTNHKVGIFKAFRVVIMHQLSFLFISVVETLEAQPAKNDVRRGIQAI